MAFTLDPPPSAMKLAAQVATAGVVYAGLAQVAGGALGIFAAPLPSMGTLQQGAAVVGTAYATCYVIYMAESNGWVSY